MKHVASWSSLYRLVGETYLMLRHCHRSPLRTTRALKTASAQSTLALEAETEQRAGEGHSELIRTVREYKRGDMILHEMKMHTVSISPSFAAAIANCAIALLLIRRKTEQQMGRRRRIKPLKLLPVRHGRETAFISPSLSLVSGPTEKHPEVRARNATGDPIVLLTRVGNYLRKLCRVATAFLFCGVVRHRNPEYFDAILARDNLSVFTKLISIGRADDAGHDLLIWIRSDRSLRHLTVRPAIAIVQQAQ
ncbi:hypothetical protein BDW62DRAFT_217732 [Aspergillus aurantiobrunneus]